MPRKLTVLFRRDPTRDHQDNKIEYEGYEMLWPDGRPVTVGLNAFCKHGQALLRLGRHLAGCRERLLDLVCFPLAGRDDAYTRLPGHRVRRFFVERHGRQGRVHFLDGTPTAVVFDLHRDESRVLQWIGLPGLRDGERQWFDVAASPTASSVPCGPSLHVPVSDAPRAHDAAF
jgi:hypothetical protein